MSVQVKSDTAMLWYTVSQNIQYQNQWISRC